MRVIIIRNIIFLFLACFLFSGCFRRDRAQAIDTLEALAAERDVQDKIIELDRKNFNSLKKAVKDDTIKAGLSELDIKKLYGEPILIKDSDISQADKVLIFTEPLKYFNTEKVYLYFSEDEKLVSWQIK
ncbi:MAG TPA: hypothetical protein ENH41_01875 [Candidatus Omnitrophica bacterium]|nr:hypothetical protein [Candidatus Omnitrophota bacterium]